jgi:hypothetical protein
MQQIPSGANYMAYDRTIVVFSPDGRLLQVEYAREAVKRGSTSVGVRLKNAVILGATKATTPLGVSESYKKIYEIDSHIGLVSSGLLSDARDLVEFARVRAQINRITYGEPISVSSLTKNICDRKHMVTQYAGVRPYGVGLLIGGVNNESMLYETDPSGTMIEWKAKEGPGEGVQGRHGPELRGEACSQGPEGGRARSQAGQPRDIRYNFRWLQEARARRHEVIYSIPRCSQWFP